jgi:hypothetical protein
MAQLSIRADDPARLKTRRRWGFPSEQSYNWEMEFLPAKKHQALERIFLHQDPQIWHTLMIHTEADLEEVDGKTVYKSFICHILFFELLRGTTQDLISTYIEPDDPPVVDWIAKRKLKAPWALGKPQLQSVSGALTISKDGKPVFGSAKVSIWKGWPKKTAFRPKLSDDAFDDSKKDDDEGLDDLDED